MIFLKYKSSLTPLCFLVCCLTLPCVSIRADDFILDPQPTWPSGNKGEIPFEQPADPAVCGLYLENLRYFARRNTPLSCERPIAPHLKDRIKKVEWEDLNPADYPDLFEALVTKRLREMGNNNPPIDKLPSGWVSRFARNIDVFRRAKLPLKGYPYYDIPGKPPGVRQALWYVQFGPNTADPENSDPIYRCKPIRGGPAREIWSDLKLYLVSEDMKTLFDRVLVLYNGGSGEALRMINGRPYVETANTGGVTLMEIDSTYPGTLEPVCSYPFKRTDSKN